MKDRAGIVGSTGVAQTIQKIRGVRTDLEVHLIGHSFGGRLVTAAANAQPAADSPIVTMSLLQAAYSHNGLAKDWDGAGNDGGFRSVVSDRKVKRSILISHSVHDFPVGTAYPLASRIMGMTAAALVGGPNDKFGGMGRNGAQHTPEAIDDTLHVVGTPYLPFAAGKWIRNLNGDGPAPAPTITSHGDIAKPEIAYAFLSHI
jgi:pimeloyl-ACP methyl ester carboxylesterase